MCAGVLVDESWVVTAASCVVDSPTVYRVVIGDARPSISVTTGQTIEAWEIYRHPDYDATSGRHNIALVELATPVTLATDVWGLPTVDIAEIADVPVVGTRMQVVGWGAEGWNDRLDVFGVTDTLTSYFVERTSGGCGLLDSSRFCARSSPGRKLTYNDLGGPIARSGQVVGIATKLNVGSLEHYTQYSKLSFYRAWIDSYVSSRIYLDLCLYEPGLCTLVEVPRFPGDCWVCNFELIVPNEGFHNIRFALPDLGVSPEAFSKAFAFRLLGANGKLIARGKGNGQEAVLEFSAKLSKGNYKLQVQIFGQSIAKTIHANNAKHPFKFTFSLVK